MHVLQQPLHLSEGAFCSSGDSWWILHLLLSQYPSFQFCVVLLRNQLVHCCIKSVGHLYSCKRWFFALRLHIGGLSCFGGRPFRPVSPASFPLLLVFQLVGQPFFHGTAFLPRSLNPPPLLCSSLLYNILFVSFSISKQIAFFAPKYIFFCMFFVIFKYINDYAKIFCLCWYQQKKPRKIKVPVCKTQNNLSTGYTIKHFIYPGFSLSGIPSHSDSL